MSIIAVMSNPSISCREGDQALCIKQRKGSAMQMRQHARDQGATLLAFPRSEIGTVVKTALQLNSSSEIAILTCMLQQNILGRYTCAQDTLLLRNTRTRGSRARHHRILAEKQHLSICTNKTCKKQGSQQVVSQGRHILAEYCHAIQSRRLSFLPLQIAKFAQDLNLKDLEVETTGCLGKPPCSSSLPSMHLCHKHLHSSMQRILLVCDASPVCNTTACLPRETNIHELS